MIAIIDYEIGNLSSVTNMLQRLGVRSCITNNALDIKQATHIILPGNGSYDACVRALRNTGLVPLLEECVLHNNVPLLGICVGAQMLGHASVEGLEHGLGWLDIQVERFPSMPGLRIPHMGWNHVNVVKADHPLTQEVTAKTRFYFTHSYYLNAKNPEDVLLRSHYGIEFAAGVVRGNIAGVQFHPEKSHRFGKHLLNAFVNWTP
jgi:imidazole glycerol-phosphate synthase subunit HisH